MPGEGQRPRAAPLGYHHVPGSQAHTDVLCVLQLAGIAVLSVGLWLRFDSQTKSIFEQENNDSSFYTGEWGTLLFLPSSFRERVRVDLGTWAGEDFAPACIASQVHFQPCFCVVAPMNLHLTDVVSFSKLTKPGTWTILSAT